MPDTIELAGLSKGTFWPLATIDLASLRAKGFDGQFQLRYTGQIDQLNVDPSACRCSTPQIACPVQPNGLTTGGKPALGVPSEVEKITVSFKTGHSNVLSGISPNPSCDDAQPRWAANIT